MEIVCIDKKAFDEICNHFSEYEDRVNRLCRPNQDLGLKNWMDNQDVCQILRISKRTLQVYREKGLIPFARIKHKIFYKPRIFRDSLTALITPLKRRDHEQLFYRQDRSAYRRDS